MICSESWLPWKSGLSVCPHWIYHNLQFVGIMMCKVNVCDIYLDRNSKTENIEMICSSISDDNGKRKLRQ